MISGLKSFERTMIAQPIYHGVSELTKKIADLAKLTFEVGQWVCVGLYGLKEILFDKTKPIPNIYRKVIVTQNDFVNKRVNRIFLKKDVLFGKVPFNVAHGGLYLTSGIFGSLAALKKMNFLNLAQSTAASFGVVGNVFFGAASLLALIQNIRIYKAAAKIPSWAPIADQIAASRLKKSAIFGIISSLNYIIATALLVIGTGATIALVFGILAVTTGCIKILYDYFRFKEAR